jgi:hypothetical protein
MIRTSVRQDNDFIKELISSTLLEQAMQFIVDNFEPEDIFGNDRMHEWGKTWADENGYVEEEE